MKSEMSVYLCVFDKESFGLSKKIIDEIDEYIDENYRDADLSLNKVAGYVNMSPCYFSSTFSQETGKTFIEYLTGVRMRHAKDLLRSTSLRSSEVASESGYQDSHYFSFLFKKTQGCTPSEYRKRVREDE